MNNKKFLDANGKTVLLPKNRKVKWRISGYALVKNRNRILMVVPTWNNQFELPGGGVEEKESLKDGIIRECYEETGYKISIPGKAPLYIGEDNFYHRHFDKFYHSLIIVYQAKLKNHKQNLKIINTQDGNEIEKVEWKSTSELHSRNTHRIAYPLIRFIKKQPQ